MRTDLDVACAAVADRVRASTVRVHDVRGRGSGSGIVWPGKGLVITNAALVRGSYALVETHDGRPFRPTLCKHDPSRDLAALHIEEAETGLEPVTTRDAAELRT